MTALNIPVGVSDFSEIQQKNYYFIDKPNLCEAWMNQWSTIFFSFKDVDGLNFEDAYNRLVAQISNLYKRHTYSSECPDICWNQAENMEKAEAMYRREKNSKKDILIGI